MKNHDFLRDYLYRAQMTKVTGNNIIFRHHTAATLDGPTQMFDISSMVKRKMAGEHIIQLK